MGKTKTQRPRTFAIVPAAGYSVRMGQPKLLMPWKDGLVIDHVLRAWTTSKVKQTMVILRADDDALHTACQKWKVTMIQPQTPPPDMRASIQQGLRSLKLFAQAIETDRVFIAPADLPTLRMEVINKMLKATKDLTNVVLPQYGDKIGGPVLLPWPIAEEIYTLGDDEEMDTIVQRHPQTLVKFPAEWAVNDINTPDDYQRELEG